MHDAWENALFVHWPVAPERLAEMLPRTTAVALSSVSRFQSFLNLPIIFLHLPLSRGDQGIQAFLLSFRSILALGTRFQ